MCVIRSNGRDLICLFLRVCHQQMRRTGNKDENKRILMDLDVVLKSHDCPYIIQCYGAIVTNVGVPKIRVFLTTNSRTVVIRARCSLNITTPQTNCSLRFIFICAPNMTAFTLIFHSSVIRVFMYVYRRMFSLPWSWWERVLRSWRRGSRAPSQSESSERWPWQ